MSFAAIQFLTGLSGSVSLFLTSAGLTVIFGVTRVVNFAHGSLFMLGAYIGWSLLDTPAARPVLVHRRRDRRDLDRSQQSEQCWRRALLRRLYHAPELFQLLATFGVLLVIQDVTIMLWGPNDLPSPAALAARLRLDPGRPVPAV